jgi:chromosome segregation ATPase
MEEKLNNKEELKIDKIDISESGIEVSNSIETFTKNLNKMNIFVNSKNKITNDSASSHKFLKNIVASSESEIIEDSSSIPKDIDRDKIKINILSKDINSNNKITTPSLELLCQKLQQKIDTLTYENYSLSKKNKDLLFQNKELKFKLSSINNEKETEIQIINEQLTNTQNKLNKKEEDNYILKEKINKYDRDIQEYEANKKEIFTLKSENDKLIIKHKKLNENILNFEKNLEFYKNKYNEISSKYEILRKEKENITRDSFIQNGKNKELISDIEKLKNEIKELKEDKNALIQKIRNYDMNQKKQYNDLINKTKEKLEIKQNEEICKIQNQKDNIIKRKIESLEEQNNNLKNKIQELEEKQINNNDIINEENKNQILRLNDEISYLKLQTQLKDSEIKRLNRIYTENTGLIKELNNENNSYKEKLKLLNDKLNEMTSNSYKEIRQLKEKFMILNSKNESLEEQDNVFDKIFSEILLDIEKNNKQGETKNMILEINELPKGNNKRISQFTLICNKLKKLSQENSLLNSKLQKALLENEKSKEEGNIYQNILQNNNEPYEYLLKELAKKDGDLLYYKELLKEKEIRFKAMIKENERLNKKYNSIEKDLKQHLENRDKIDKLDFLVRKIAENQKKMLGEDNLVKFEDQLVTTNLYKIARNTTLRKGKQK